MRRALLLLATIGAAANAGTQTFDVDRPWIGPGFWANRLGDWHVAEGRLECVAGEPRLPLRTVHLITHEVRPQDVPDGALVLDLTVTLGPLADDPSDDALAGFLIGAGDESIDYRLSAQVHHKPAADGGVLAIVDPTGRVAIRDNSIDTGRHNLWSIAGPVSLEDIPEIDAERRAAATAGPAGQPVTLHLEIRRTADACTAVLESRDPGGGLLSRADYRLALDQVDGNIALVSHRGAPGAGFWFDDWSVIGEAVRVHPDRAYGPILFTQYTLTDNVLKLNAQAPPLGPDDTQTAILEAQSPKGEWTTIAEARLTEDSYLFPFRVENWDASRDTPVRIVYDLATSDGATTSTTYDALIRREPTDTPTVSLAALDCHKIYTGHLQWNHDSIWFPSVDLVERVATQDPDLICFLGDQIYEGDLTPLDAAPVDKAILDYHYKWQRFTWSFHDLTRDRPTITIPDDHDVFHGNLWGAGGKEVEGRNGVEQQDSGGYKEPARFVNMVHATQSGHLPDPPPEVDDTPIGVGVTVYTTRVEYAGLSIAVLADRQWKSAPKALLPDADVVNGWARNPDWDPRTQSDAPGAQLLGEMQEAFLDDWALDWRDDTDFKVVLSQTPFANVATLPEGASSGGVIPSLPILEPGEYPENHHPAADMDSGGWPPSARDRAILAMRRGYAIHVAGDQHLASTIRYGVETFDDAGYCFTIPAIANTWPRRWQPAEEGAGRALGMPRYTGRYLDGFGNRMTVLAVANPVRTGKEPADLHDHVPGYGILRFERDSRRITIECWPRWADPAHPEQQYRGWPIIIEQEDNLAPPVEQRWWLPRLTYPGEAPPIQVVDEETGDVLYAIRPGPSAYQPWTFGPGTYTIRYRLPDGRWREKRGLRAASNPMGSIQLR